MSGSAKYAACKTYFRPTPPFSSPALIWSIQASKTGRPKIENSGFKGVKYRLQTREALDVTQGLVMLWSQDIQTMGLNV